MYSKTGQNRTQGTELLKKFSLGRVGMELMGMGRD